MIEKPLPDKPFIAVVIPVHNDWESFATLIGELDHQLTGLVSGVVVFAVDDGSIDPAPAMFSRDFRLINEVTVIELVVNLGHQRAIAIGLSESAGRESDCVIVMDADGEDRPVDVGLLIHQHQRYPDLVLVAERIKRAESFAFRAFYWLYKSFFLLATGMRISHGNFCLIPRPWLGPLLHSPHTWNNLAASIVRSKVPYRAIPTERGIRYFGQSHMSFIALLLHGLGAISVYLDVMSARILTVCTIALGLLAVTVVALLGLRLFTEVPLPGWTSLALGLLAILMMQTLIFSAGILFSLLNSRSQASVIPVAISASYVRSRIVLTPAAAESSVATR